MRTETMLSELPDALRGLVESYMAESGADFGSADAMHGRCEDHSVALTRALDGIEIDDPYGDPYPLSASCVQTWMDEVPQELEGNEMAGGHFIVAVRHDIERYEIDLTAAQFPEMGWTGPIARQTH